MAKVDPRMEALRRIDMTKLPKRDNTPEGLTKRAVAFLKIWQKELDKLRWEKYED